MNHVKGLVLFDFDGTITTHDTLFVFTKFLVGSIQFYIGLIRLMVTLVLQKLNLISAQQAKNIFLTYFLKNRLVSDFNDSCNRFTHVLLPNIIRPGALDAITTYKKKGYRVVIVSASPENWILPWASKNGIEVIATRLEIKDEHLTGEIAGYNCNGEEKINRIKQYLDLKAYDEIIAYGDSKGDKPMLALAHHPHYKPFRK